MKASKIASTDLPRTPKNAMAPAAEKPEEDLERDGHFDLEHLMKAEEIKKDPLRMDYVHKAHEKKSAQMRSIADLKVAGQALAAKSQDEAKAKAAQPRHKTRYPEKK